MASMYCLLIFCAFGGVFAAAVPPVVFPKDTLPPIRIATNCTYHGKTYLEGSFRPSPCEPCHCQGGRVMCAIVDCAPQMCVDAVHHADQCCPVCPNGPNCVYKGHTIKKGDSYHPDAFTECRCPDNPFHFGFGGSGANAICLHRATKPPIHIIKDPVGGVITNPDNASPEN